MNKQELLNKLFNWSAALEIKDQTGTPVMTVYQRIVGDYDLQAARKAALRYTSQLRARVSKEDSDDYAVYVAPVLVLSREEREVLAFYDSVYQVQKEAERLVRLPEPKEPDASAPTEEFEKYVELDDTYETRYMRLLNDKTNELLQRRKEEIHELTDEELEALVIKNRIDSLCEEELKSKFFEHCVYLGTYEDGSFKKRLFTSFEDFGNCVEHLKMQFMTGYASLEMSAVSLKESQKIQPSGQQSDLQKN